jgi:hypothetical protein
VTPEAVQAAYDAAIADFEPATEYSAAHILVETEEEANDLLAQIEGGADFAALATEHSQDPGSGANGGALGWFGAGRMVPEFEAAVVGLEPGGLAGPVQTQFGWHLIRLDETRETTPPPLEAVRAEVENQVRQEAVQAELEALRAGASIELVENAVAPAAIRDPAVLGAGLSRSAGAMGKLKNARDKAAKAAVRKLRKQVKKLQGAVEATVAPATAGPRRPSRRSHRPRGSRRCRPSPACASPRPRPGCGTGGGST